MTEVLFAYPASTPEYLRAIRADRKLSSKAKLLCIMLSTHGLRNAWAQDLADEMSVHPNTVTAAKKEAVAAGWLEYVWHGGQGNALHDEFNLTVPLPELTAEPVNQPQPVGAVSAPTGHSHCDPPITTTVNDRSQPLGMTDHNHCEPEIDLEIDLEIETENSRPLQPNVRVSAPAGAKWGAGMTLAEKRAAIRERFGVR